MDEALSSHAEMVAGALRGAVKGHAIAFGELTITVAAAEILQVAQVLRDDERCQYRSFIDVTASDWPGREPRFDVVYHLLSPRQNRRIRVKLEADETTP